MGSEATSTGWLSRAAAWLRVVFASERAPNLDERIRRAVAP